MPIFRIKSVKIYTGQKKFTRVYPWDPWQIRGMVYMRRRDILIRIPPSYRHIVFIINEDIQLMRILWAFIKTMLVFAPKSLLLLWQKIQMPLWRDSWNVEAVEGGWGNKLKMCLVFFSFFYVKANIICIIIQSLFSAVPIIFVKL